MAVHGVGENDCKCSEGPSCDDSGVIAVSAVSLLLIVTLTTVSLTQCLLIIRMRRDRVAQATNTTSSSSNSNSSSQCAKTTDVKVYSNKAYELHKVASVEEVIYEVV